MGQSAPSTSTSARPTPILSTDQYNRLEAQLPKIDPRTTDPVQAGIALGIQFTLQKLRLGFTAE